MAFSMIGERARAVTQPIPGWRFNYAAGFVPLLAGVLVLVTTWINVARASSPWWLGIGSLGFSYASLSAPGASAAAYVELLGSVGGVNIVGAAIAVIVVARFGLRNGQPWAWWFLAFCLVLDRCPRFGDDDSFLPGNRTAVHADAVDLQRADAGGSSQIAPSCVWPLKREP